MKVFCTDFNLLVGNSSAEDPLMTSLYLRGDHTLLNSGKRVMITSWMKGLSYMPQLVVRIDRAGKGFEPRFADRYYRRAAWGVALADRQLVLDRLSQRMDPGVAYSFDGSLAVGDFYPIEELLRGRPLFVSLRIRFHCPRTTGSMKWSRRWLSSISLRRATAFVFPSEMSTRLLRAGITSLLQRGMRNY